ncbi:MAG: hypothetical protein MJ108_09265 [Saccharofermentans sp.]|nr:hypothetical protein [Saccharofermentans sp.]
MINVTLDWKSFLALGCGISAIILAYNSDAITADSVLTGAVDAGKEYAISRKRGC